MTVEIVTPEPEAEVEKKAGLFGRLVQRVKGSLSAINQHCESVEQAKAACDRENTVKHGKDWVNRCCG